MPDTAAARLRFRSSEPLRYRDLDPQGHVNNSIYSTLFEQNRVAFQLSPGGFAEAEGQAVVLASMTVDFIRELHWPGAVEIALGVGRIGRTSFEVLQEMWSGGELAARARCAQVLISLKTRRPVPLSPDQRQQLEAWQV